MHYSVTTSKFDATPPEWLKLGSQCGELTNKWAERTDIIAFIGKGATAGLAAALFNPVLAEMELNVTEAFGEGAKPEFIGDLTERDVQFDYPVACGAILHESQHARHTLYSFADVHALKDKRLTDLIIWFEESRIEARGIEHWPMNRAFLRASALKLVTSDMKGSAEDDEKSGSVMQMSKLMLLTMARVTAGVLDPVDVQPVTEASRRMMTDPVVDALTLIWTRAQAHRVDEDFAPLQKCAEDWLKVLEDAGYNTKPPNELGEGISISAQDLADALGKTLDELMDELGEMAADAEIRARDEAGDQADTEEQERRVAASSAKEQETDNAKKEASKVFGKGTTDLHAGTSSRCIDERPPTDAERAAAVTVARMLEKAKYLDRVVEKRNNIAPPGRLRSRAAVQSAAEEARGAMRTAAPWSSKRRYHTQDPELRVGMMTDISGSMSSAMEPMAVTNWVFSEAGRRIQAKLASVYFGNSVFPGLAPGQHLDKVKVYSAADGTERFDKGFRALDGQLSLLNSTGARLLVVVSDLHHTVIEREAERHWFERCSQEGVAVLIMPFEARGHFIRTATEGLPGVHVLSHVNDPVTAALEIGHAAAEALTIAGSRG